MSRMPLKLLVAAKARRDVRSRTRGLYPAPLRAIEVCVRAVGEPIEVGLALERTAFLELVRTPECRHLMEVHFLQERAKKLSAPAGGKGGSTATPDGAPPAAPVLHPVRRVAVFGAGTMGAGIAQWIGSRGIPVRLSDISPAALARGLQAIRGVQAGAVKRRVLTPSESTAVLDRITPVHVDLPLTDVDLVIEAVLEKLELKQDLFRRLEARIGPECVLATNTSALSIDAIASALRRPERLVGIHFFNPVHRMQLIEIVEGPRTSPAALATAVQFARKIGKLPVITRDSPGFLVNRILLPYLIEAVRLFAEGGRASEIDRVMLDFGMPMGPLRLCDEVGLDVAQHVAKDLERRLAHPVPVNDLLEKMVAGGWLGRKSGRGFYLHAGDSPRLVPNSDAAALQSSRGPRSDDGTWCDRMVLVMINEAARVLAEAVVAAPEDVDFGMIMGTGWAPFRGGPLRHADTVGAVEVVRRLDVLAREVAPHFAPAPMLREIAAAGRGFYPRRSPEHTAAAAAATRPPAGDRLQSLPGPE
jgi:3-hydroxyacyl-CoA dehydrogenase/enoyl-CoA hydratase/3-hydroxybutyryl-CoA epimerase